MSEPTPGAAHAPADAPSAGAPISRREGLRRSAALLALGLGAPASAAALAHDPAADGGGAREFYQIKFYADGEPVFLGGDPERPVAVDLPADVAEALADRRAFNEIKIEIFDDERGREGRTLAAYRVDRTE